jgi:hypothetical protein
MRSTIFWDVTSCSLVGVEIDLYLPLDSLLGSGLPYSSTLKIDAVLPPKRRWTSTGLHGATPQRTALLKLQNISPGSQVRRVCSRLFSGRETRSHEGVSFRSATFDRKVFPFDHYVASCARDVRRNARRPSFGQIARYSFPILTKFLMYRQILVKLSNEPIKVRDIPFAGQTDTHGEFSGLGQE